MFGIESLTTKLKMNYAEDFSLSRVFYIDSQGLNSEKKICNRRINVIEVRNPEL